MEGGGRIIEKSMDFVDGIRHISDLLKTREQERSAKLRIKQAIEGTNHDSFAGGKVPLLLNLPVSRGIAAVVGLSFAIGFSGVHFAAQVTCSNT